MPPPGFDTPPRWKGVVIVTQGLGVGVKQLVHWFLGGKDLGGGAKQSVHWVFGGEGLGIQQGMSVWVGLPKLWFGGRVNQPIY